MADEPVLTCIRCGCECSVHDSYPTGPRCLTSREHKNCNSIRRSHNNRCLKNPKLKKWFATLSADAQQRWYVKQRKLDEGGTGGKRLWDDSDYLQAMKEESGLDDRDLVAMETYDDFATFWYIRGKVKDEIDVLWEEALADADGSVWRNDQWLLPKYKGAVLSAFKLRSTVSQATRRTTVDSAESLNTLVGEGQGLVGESEAAARAVLRQHVGVVDTSDQPVIRDAAVEAPVVGEYGNTAHRHFGLSLRRAEATREEMEKYFLETCKLADEHAQTQQTKKAGKSTESLVLELKQWQRAEATKLKDEVAATKVQLNDAVKLLEKMCTLQDDLESKTDLIDKLRCCHTNLQKKVEEWCKDHLSQEDHFAFKEAVEMMQWRNPKKRHRCFRGSSRVSESRWWKAIIANR